MTDTDIAGLVTRLTEIAEGGHVPGGVSDETVRHAIRVEKMLCALLGREWQPTGMSILSLCVDLARALERLQAERDGRWQDIATDTLARIIFEACMAERVINGISGWDERNSETAYAGSTWKTHTPGLRAAEKLKWQRVAVRLRRTLPRSPT